MRQLILSIATGVATVLVMNTILREAIIPRFWGSPDAWAKLELQQKNPERFNAMIIGNSKTKRNIDSSLITGLRIGDKEAKFMNMGADSMVSEEELYIVKTMIEEGVRPIIVVAQVMPGRALGANAEGTGRGQYFQSLLSLIRTYGSLMEEQSQSGSIFFRGYAKSYAKKILHVNLFSEIEHAARDSSKEVSKGKNDDGFFPLEWQDQNLPWLVERKKFREAHAENLIKLKEKVQSIENETCDTVAINASMKPFEIMMDIAKKEGFKLRFFLEFPNISLRTRCLFEALPQEYRIDPVTLEEAPHLFETDAYYDLYHLRVSAAQEYTKILRRKLEDSLQ